MTMVLDDGMKALGYVPVGPSELRAGNVVVDARDVKWWTGTILGLPEWVEREAMAVVSVERLTYLEMPKGTMIRRENFATLAPCLYVVVTVLGWSTPVAYYPTWPWLYKYEELADGEQ